MLRLEPNARLLGLDPEYAAAWADEMSERFHLWAGSKDSSVDGVNNFYQSQHMYAFLQQRDNDIFVRMHYKSDPSLISPLQIQILDPDQVGGAAYTATDGYLATGDGIVRDADGREVSYEVSVWDAGQGTYRRVNVPARDSASGRRIMLHGFQPEYAGQGRGFPLLSHALQEFEQITDFSQAQIQKAINQSNLVFYTKPSKDAPASMPLQDFLAPASPRPSAVLGANPTDAGAFTDEPVVKFELLREATVRQSGSVYVAGLMGGEDLRPVENTAPSESYDRFVDAFVTHLAASVSMPVEVLLMKFGANDSASRAALAKRSG
jgi:capsid protein